MTITRYKRQRINKLKAEIAKIEADQYRYVEVLGNDPDAQIYALESKKRLLVRAIVIENHLAIEHGIDDLIRIEVAKRNPRRRPRKRITPFAARRYFDEIFREGQSFLSGGSSIGFARKAALARMLRLIDKRMFDDVIALNSLRNRCGHISTLADIDRKKGRQKGSPPRYSLAFKGKSLFDTGTLLEFMEKYNDVFLHLGEKATGLKIR